MATPKTDAAIRTTRELNQHRRGLCANEYDAGELQYVDPDFARQLETQAQELRAALEELVLRCDGDEGVRADGSNIQTYQARAILEKTK